jgi:hypothetical protein
VKCDIDVSGALIDTARYAPYGAQAPSGVRSLASIADAPDARGIRTARGGRWHVSTIQNLLVHASAVDARAIL